MFVYKNKKSGKYSIYLKEENINEALFITPPGKNGEVREIILELDIFYEPEEIAEDNLSNKEFITDEQLEKYNKYCELQDFIANLSFEKLLEHLTSLPLDRLKILKRETEIGVVTDFPLDSLILLAIERKREEEDRKSNSE